MVLQDIQKHRGAAAVWLGGNASYKGLADMAAGRIDNSLAQAKAALRPGTDTATLDQITQNWQSLRGQVGSLTVDASRVAHTQLIKELMALIEAAAMTSGALLDPDPQTHYLIDAVLNRLPPVLEQLGRTRVLGAQIFSQGHASASDLQMLAMASDSLVERTDAVLSVMARAAKGHTGLNNAVDELRSGTLPKITELLSLIPASPDAPIKDSNLATWFKLATESMDAYYTITETRVLPALPSHAR